MKSAKLYATVLTSFLLFSGCGFEGNGNDRVDKLINEPVAIEAGTADRADVELDMKVGEMKVSGGGTKLLEGSIEYNVARWKPEIVSTKNGVHATVTVRQPEGGGNFGGRTKNIWDLQLANKTLLDLSVNCGVGESKLSLGDVLLRSLTVKTGVGEVNVDLSGKPTHDYDVRIQGGIGKASIRLPEGVGIYATAKGGIGSINVTGLQKHDDHWENDLYEKAKVNVRIDVKGGIGEVRLIG